MGRFTNWPPKVDYEGVAGIAGASRAERAEYVGRMADQGILTEPAYESASRKKKAKKKSKERLKGGRKN